MDTRKTVLTGLLIAGVLALQAPVFGQVPVPAGRALWSLPEQLKEWNAVQGDPSQSYIPQHDLGLSSLAFDKDNKHFYAACEKYPALLQFDASGGNATLIRLDIPRLLDIEAMSVHGGFLYLVDEDGPGGPANEVCDGNEHTVNQPLIYMYDLEKKSLNKTPIQVDPKLGISIDCPSYNPSDARSVEGLVVYHKWLFPQRSGQSIPDRPYFYLLDEQTKGQTGHYATLSVATKDASGVLCSAAKPVRFKLDGDSERLPELFLHNEALYAIKSYYDNKPGGKAPRYDIVRLIVNDDGTGGHYEGVCELTQVANRLVAGRFSSNIEGAAVGPDGALFLVTDNENRDPSVKSDKPHEQPPPPTRRYIHGKSAFVRLSPAGK